MYGGETEKDRCSHFDRDHRKLEEPCVSSDLIHYDRWILEVFWSRWGDLREGRWRE